MTASAVPFVFSPNTLIQSAQVNADFTSVVGSLNNIDAGQITTGVLPVANGGTGVTTSGAITTSIGAVAKSGDTMTGILTVPQIVYSGTLGHGIGFGWDGNVHNYVDGTDVGSTVMRITVGNGLGGGGGPTAGTVTLAMSGSYSGNFTATGSVNAGFLNSTGGGGITGGLNVTGNVSVGGSIGATGTVGSSANVAAATFVNTPYLTGGANGAGTLRSHSVTDTICFRWDATAQELAWRVDEVVERYISSTVNVFRTYYNASGGPTSVGFFGADVPGNVYIAYIDALSDERIKQNIQPTGVDALGVLKRVEVSQFDVKGPVAAWIKTIGRDMPERVAAMQSAEPVHVPIGFVAQRIQPHVPEATNTVRQDDQAAESPLPVDVMNVSKDEFVPYLVRAVQQLVARVEALEAARGTP